MRSGTGQRAAAMGDDDVGLALRLKLVEAVNYMSFPFLVDRACGLVKVQYGRAAGDPAGEGGPFPRFPGWGRDVWLLVSDAIPAGRITGVFAAVAEPLVSRVRVLEDYRDVERLGAGVKSMLWSIEYRAPDRTLTDAEVEKAHEGIVARLLANLPAQRR